MIVRELRKPAGKNLLMILVAATMIGLVQIQIVWLFFAFDSVPGRVTHLLQSISLEAAKSANLLATLFVICFCSLTYRLDTTRPTTRNDQIATGRAETTLTYSVAMVWVLGAGAALAALAGGISSALEKPGQAVAGQTLFLILVSLGKIPLARKIALRRSVNALDVILYTAAFSLLLFNSRFLAAYAVLQLAMIFHYRRKEASTGVIVGLGAALMAIFVVFGLYREAAYARIYTPGFSTTEFIESNFTSGEAFNWFYAKNVEGFVGLAGIITYESDKGSLDHDYGVSNLLLLGQLLPNSIRTDPDLPFNDLAEGVRSAYPYNGSVVPSGLEASYAHFGPIGVIGLGFLLGYLVVKIHRILLETSESAVTASLVSVHVLSLIREMIATAVFFALGEIFIVACYHKLLDLTAKPFSIPSDFLGSQSQS
jgi:hypothetical protein